MTSRVEDDKDCCSMKRFFNPGKMRGYHMLGALKASMSKHKPQSLSVRSPMTLHKLRNKNKHAVAESSAAATAGRM